MALTAIGRHEITYSCSVIELYEELQKEHSDCLRTDGSRPPSELQSNADNDVDNADRLIGVRTEGRNDRMVKSCLFSPLNASLPQGAGIENVLGDDVIVKGGYGSLIDEEHEGAFEGDLPINFGPSTLSSRKTSNDNKRAFGKRHTRRNVESQHHCR